MKIVFVGGGTGGHFYPLISVAEEIDSRAQENQLVRPKKYYFGPSAYNEKALYDAGMRHVYCPAGKLRRTGDFLSTIKNFFSLFSVLAGALKAFVNLLIIFPDAVFSKGGYASFPVLWAARLLRIPVVIHESDSVLGRVNRWSASFAERIAVSYPEAEQSLTEGQRKKAALVGIPIRRQLLRNPYPDAHALLKLDPKIPTVVVLGGSSGARFLNDSILDALPLLLKKYQVVHQTGERNIEGVKSESASFLRALKGLHAYRPLAHLNAHYMRVLYSVADVIITRAGSGTLFEIAEWGIPSIVVPIPDDVSHDQRSNAYAYARSAGGTVIEERNFSLHLLLSRIDAILSDERVRKDLSERAKSFSSPGAAEKIARLLVDILKSHEA